MLPAIVVMKAEVYLDKRPPLGPLGFTDQPHGRFLRCSVGLLSVTPNARTHYVLPGGRTAPVTRDDMIQIKIFPIKCPAAVLARILVSLEDIVPRELDFLFRQAVKHDQQN